jgi:hypothetical protein
MERIEYEYIYFDTLKEDHVDPKLPVTLENLALDFSFWDITDVISLKKKDPRDGKRKEIVDSDNEKDDKLVSNQKPSLRKSF